MVIEDMSKLLYLITLGKRAQCTMCADYFLTMCQAISENSFRIT